MRRRLTWLLWVTIAAVLIHLAAVAFAPNLIMLAAFRLLERADVNAIVHFTRPTASWRTIVRAGPDLVYSMCVYDVSRGPVRVVTGAPPDTYWSVSFYADNTDNFFVLNDLEAGQRPATVILLGEGQEAGAAAAGATVVAAPSRKGLVLFRTVISGGPREAEIDSGRRAASCEALPTDLAAAP